MYKIITKDTTLLLPKGNIRYLAMQKAIDLNQTPVLKTEDDAIKFLNSLGIRVEE